MTDFDDDRPMRPVSARRRAEQVWRKTEPWRVKENRVRYRNIVLVALVVAGLAIYLSVINSSTPALAPNDIVAIGETNGHLEMHFSGCGSSGLYWVGIYGSEPLTARQPFEGNAIWLIEADKGSVPGAQDFQVGTAPAGFRNLLDFGGLSQFPPNHQYWVEADTTSYLVRFAFSQSLLDGSNVLTPTGRFSLSTYTSDSSHTC